MFRLHIRLYPNAPRNQVWGFQDGVWKIRIAAPPVEGKANSRLVDFISRLLGIAKSNITIERGQTSRDKILAIQGIDDDAVLARLRSSLPSAGPL